MENQIDKIFELHDQGFSAGKIAQKMKIKKTEVQQVLGDANDKGLGDKIEKFTEATGIKDVVESMFKDCGCAARKETLNKLFPNRKLNNLSVEHFDWLTNFFKDKKSSVSSDEQKMLVEIYNEVFNAKRRVSNCSPCVAKVVDELKRIYAEASKKY